MKIKRREISKVVVVAAFAVVLALTAFSENGKETSIKNLDSVEVNGGILHYSYSIKSNCPTRSHNSYIIITTESKQRVVNSFHVKIKDIANENQCGGVQENVEVSGTSKLANEIKVKSKELVNRGFKISNDATVFLPPIRSAALENASAGSGGATNSGWKNETTLPVMVNVVVVEYTPGWKCTLYKNDGARRDGFEGTGTTLEEARRDAATECKSTNNSYCDEYSNSPDHTTCEAQFQETTKVAQYNSDKLPPGATLDSWRCVLRKNDGFSRNSDGFEGNGKTEAAARIDAASKCSSTKNPRCDIFSKDDNHTTCSPQMTVYGQKPSAVWKCTLWKNDGSRNDGFTGTGSTETEARRDTMPGCQRTNNPKCSAYANDPTHTQCTVDFVYPQ